MLLFLLCFVKINAVLSLRDFFKKKKKKNTTFEW